MSRVEYSNWPKLFNDAANFDGQYEATLEDGSTYLFTRLRVPLSEKGAPPKFVELANASLWRGDGYDTRDIHTLAVPVAAIRKMRRAA